MNGMDQAWDTIVRKADAMVEKSGERGLSEAQRIDRFLRTKAGQELYEAHQGAFVVEHAKNYLVAGHYLPGAGEVVRKANKAADTEKVKKASLKKGRRIIEQIDAEIRFEDAVDRVRKEERARAMKAARAELTAEARSQGYDLRWQRR